MDSCTISLKAIQKQPLHHVFVEMGDATKLYIQNNAMHTANQHCHSQNSAMKHSLFHLLEHLHV